MADVPVSLSAQSAMKLARSNQKVEGLLRVQTGVPPVVSPDDGVEQWVQITSTTQTAGRYPGQWYLRNANAGTWTAQTGAVWVVTPNGETLVTGTLYRAFCSGVVGVAGDGSGEGRLEFVAVVPVAAASFSAWAGINSSLAASPGTATFFTPTNNGYTFFPAGTPTILAMPTSGSYLVSLMLGYRASTFAAVPANSSIQATLVPQAPTTNFAYGDFKYVGAIQPSHATYPATWHNWSFIHLSSEVNETYKLMFDWSFAGAMLVSSGPANNMGIVIQQIA